MKRLRLVFLTFGVGIGLCLILSNLAKKNDRFSVQRLDDVHNLLHAYLPILASEDWKFNNVTIEDLELILKQKHVVLNNPIPRDPSKSCYEIVRPVIRTNMTGPTSEPLIQETTNVNDDLWVAVGYIDGHCGVIRRQENTMKEGKP